MHTFTSHRNPPGGSWRAGCGKFLMAILLVVSSGVGATAGSSTGSASVLAAPPAGWALDGRPYRHDPGNLYEYIDGAAEFFIALGFVELAGANYVRAAGGEDVMTVDVYDMGGTLNAFGIFQSRKDVEKLSSRFGAASTASGNYLAFYKGRYYVEIQAYSPAKKEIPEVEAAAAAVAGRLPGDNRPPPELSLLPESRRVAGSERYVKGGILGHEFFDSGITCSYLVGGKTVSVFLAMLPSPRAATEASERHRSFLKASGKALLPLEGLGEGGFVSDEPYHQKIVEARYGAMVIGVYDLSDVAAGKALAAEILEQCRQARHP